MVYQVQQAPGCGNHNVGATAQAHHLRVNGHATKEDADLDARALLLGQLAQAVANLGRQFPRGHQNKGARLGFAGLGGNRVFMARLKTLQKGQGESHGFA